MKKKIIIIIVLVILFTSFIIFGIYLYNYLKVKNAKIEVTLIDNLKLEFNDKKHVSDFIKDINGKIVGDYIIDSTKLGNKNIKFNFINDDNIKVKYDYNIEIVDTVKPVVWVGSSYTVLKGSDIDLAKKIMCGDNYDNKPKCSIEGNYDLNSVGKYNLVYKAVDNSGNENNWPFTLNVVEPQQNTNTNYKKVNTKFSDVVDAYKTDNTKIGIDISQWQGDVDFEKIKNAGVEFVMIRVGYQKGIDGEYVIDPKFERNIKEANKYKIKAGIYFYSYANSEKRARSDAKWVLKQIKDYKIDYPIAFDWEEWNNFNEFNLSFFGLTNMANVFIEEVENKGYNGMLYSSKSYLESIWLDNELDIWLAHYTKQTDYKGDYKMWQLCDNGLIDGINSDVDIDILYTNNDDK